MLKIKSYVKVNSLAEAYELNQKKTARILGGMVWMKMGNRAISTAIDLSGLGLDAISENDDEFVIGCMTPLHDLETNEALNTYTHGAMKESLCHIVGVQFRNCATVGTFATTVYLCNGGTIEALSKILGHKHISTTQIYAEVTNRMVSSDFRAISGNLAAMQRSVLEKKDRKQDGKRVRRSLRETA